MCLFLIRTAAVLNSVWGITTPISGIRESEACKDWSFLNKTQGNWENNFDKAGFGYKQNLFAKKYLNKMGLYLISPNYGMRGVCPLFNNKQNVTHTKWGDNGMPPNGRKYAYSSYWLKVNWHPSYIINNMSIVFYFFFFALSFYI